MPSRRYRGLHVVSAETRKPMPPRLTSLAQTQAIVAQVGREIEQQAIRQGQQSNPRSASTGAAPIPFRAAARPLSTARRFVLALLPTTL